MLRSATRPLVSLAHLTVSAPTLARRGFCAALVAMAATGCAHRPPSTSGDQWPLVLRTVLPADVLLLGEQHDDPEHQRMQHAAVQWLAIRNQLGAVVLEMAERGTGTAQLPTEATPAQVQAALQWQDSAWPWEKYGPTIMEAVRAGVPVLGGNLPRTQTRVAMRNAELDQALPLPALERQRQAIRDGHCQLLAEAQVPGMARIQVARDKAMAQTLVEAQRTAANTKANTVVLISGAGHSLRTVGVPMHLPPQLTTRVVVALQQRAPGGDSDKNGDAATAKEVGRLVPAEADLVWISPWRDTPDACEALRKKLE